VVGIVGAVPVLAGVPTDLVAFKPGAWVGAVMGLVEIFLGIRPLVRGLGAPAAATAEERSGTAATTRSQTP
jgi:hypothetical protein